VSQRKDPADRHPRRGSENRQRQKIVAVRFNLDEYSALVLAAAREEKGMGTLLREAFLRSNATAEASQ
jgi:hypothetical protein